MAVCNPQDLLDANPCFAELSPFMREVVFTQMLCALYNNLDSGEPLSCDIAVLLADAECFYGLSMSQLKIVQLQLMCEVFSLL